MPIDLLAQKPTKGPRDLFASDDEQQAPASPKQMGTILPFSRDETGVHFDSDAGILGSLKSAVTLPRDVMRGDVDPMSDEAIGRSAETAALFSPMNPASRATARVLPGVKPKTRPGVARVPSADELLAAGADDFAKMRATNVDYSSASVKSMAETLSQTLQQEGFHPKVAKRTHAILKELTNPPENSVVNIQGIHALRKTLRKVAGNFNEPADQKAAMEAISRLDDFIGSPPSGGVVAGLADDAARALKSGNANYAAGKRSDLINGIERATGLRSSAANSGQNVGNTVRQKVASALLQPKKIAGYNAAEQAALEGIVNGSNAANTTRYIGNLLGGGGGLGQSVVAGIGGATGMAAGGPAGAGAGVVLPMAVGAGSKQLSNFLTKNALKSADEMIRMRSPLAQRLATEAPNIPIPPDMQAAIVRALMASQQANKQDRR